MPLLLYKDPSLMTTCLLLLLNLSYPMSHLTMQPPIHALTP
jgi:hypothetical protein